MQLWIRYKYPISRTWGHSSTIVIRERIKECSLSRSDFSRSFLLRISSVSSFPSFFGFSFPAPALLYLAISPSVFCFEEELTEFSIFVDHVRFSQSPAFLFHGDRDQSLVARSICGVTWPIPSGLRTWWRVVMFRAVSLVGGAWHRVTAIYRVLSLRSLARPGIVFSAGRHDELCFWLG